MFVCTILLLQFSYFVVKYTRRGPVDSWFHEWHSDMPGLFDGLICLKKYLSYYCFKIYFSDLFLPLLMEFWVYFYLFSFFKKENVIRKKFQVYTKVEKIVKWTSNINHSNSRMISVCPLLLHLYFFLPSFFWLKYVKANPIIIPFHPCVFKHALLNVWVLPHVITIPLSHLSKITKFVGIIQVTVQIQVSFIVFEMLPYSLFALIRIKWGPHIFIGLFGAGEMFQRLVRERLWSRWRAGECCELEGRL